MDAPEVEQLEVADEESKPKGKWWYGAIAGGVVAFGLPLLILTPKFIWFWDMFLLLVVVPGFIGGALGGALGRNQGNGGVIGLGGFFGGILGVGVGGIMYVGCCLMQ